jgi:hypothetical protein
MRHVYYDSEFHLTTIPEGTALQDGARSVQTTGVSPEPLSVAFATEDGSGIYMIFRHNVERDPSRFNDFVKAHVVPYLDTDLSMFPGVETIVVDSDEEARKLLLRWFRSNAMLRGEPTRIWALRGGSDMALLHNLWGGWDNFPRGLPKGADEISTLTDLVSELVGDLNVLDSPEDVTGPAHNCMVDALVVRSHHRWAMEQLRRLRLPR